MTKITILNIKDRPDRAREIWSRVYDADPNASAFMRWEWMSNWIKYFSEDRDLYLVYASDSDDLPVAMIPIMVEPVKVLGLTFTKKIQLLGSDSLACSEHLGFLIKQDLDTAIIGDLLSFIWQHYQGNKYLLFPDLNADSRDTVFMTDWAQRENISQRTKNKGGCWQTDLPDSWDKFLAKLSTKFRKQINRNIRKIENSSSLSIQQVTDEDTVKRAAEKQIELNLKRMSGKGINSCFNTMEMRNFFVDMTVDMVCSNKAWMDVICSDNIIVATTMHLVDTKSVSYYQGGFDEEFDKEFTKLSPMGVLFATAIQRGIDNKCKTYDFLSGNEAYKQRWRAELQQYVTISALSNNTIRNSLIQMFELYNRAKTAKKYYFP